MNLAPGRQGTVTFNVTQSGNLSNVGTASITVIRNGIVTTVPVTIDNSVVGRYVGTFTVPGNWEEYDIVEAAFTLSYMQGTLNNTIECTKQVGTVTLVPGDIDFINAILTADQVKIGNTIQYFQAGTNQTVLLHTQVLSGDPCDDTGTSSVIMP